MTIIELSMVLDEAIRRGYGDREIVDENCKTFNGLYPPVDDNDAPEAMLVNSYALQGAIVPPSVCPECGREKRGSYCICQASLV